MIALANQIERITPHHSQGKFLAMLPLIREQAQHAFRNVRPEEREELIAEVIANAFCAYQRLVARGQEDIAYATPLAMYAIKQVRAGRRVGAKLNIRDVSSTYAQRVRGFQVERLDEFNPLRSEWNEVLVEDRKAGPAETAAARIDAASWFNSLDRQKRRIAKVLSRGELTSVVARMFGLSPGRVSQLRSELKRSWDQFQGEAMFA
jgi:hypothetical protein